MKNLLKYLSPCLLAVATLLGGTSPARAQVSLGTASGFSVLAGTNVTCTAGVVTGDIGVSPGGAVAFTNTGCTIAGGSPPATDAAAVQARTDFLVAYTALQAQTGSCVQMPGNLSGQNLPPGVYCVDAVAKAGTLTLSGPSTGVWIFLVAGALTGTNFSVAMSGGGQPCNVFWAPTGAATMTTSAFKGNILAGDAAIGSITLTGGTLAGRALANVAVTMTGASVIGCGALSGPSTTCKGKDGDAGDDGKQNRKCNNGKGDGTDDCDSGRSRYPFGSNDERSGKHVGK
jgi:hypothetical protein